MPTRKRTSAPKASKKASRAPRTQALAVKDAVKREPWLSYSLVEKQWDLMRAMASWSPVGLVAGQQAAFWRGFLDEQHQASNRRRVR
jgi:hypothetical protein